MRVLDVKHWIPNREINILYERLPLCFITEGAICTFKAKTRMSLVAYTASDLHNNECKDVWHLPLMRSHRFFSPLTSRCQSQRRTKKRNTLLCSYFTVMEVKLSAKKCKTEEDDGYFAEKRRDYLSRPEKDEGTELELDCSWNNKTKSTKTKCNNWAPSVTTTDFLFFFMPTHNISWKIRYLQMEQKRFKVWL